MECPICLTTFETDAALIPQLVCSCVFVVHPDCWLKWNQACLYCRTEIIQEPIIELQNIDRYYKLRICLTLLYFAIMIYNIFNPHVPNITPAKYRPIQKCIANISFLDEQICNFK